MGFFSWNTSDTNESISNVFSSRGTFPVKMLDNHGNSWFEIEYEGYGEFGGRDYYELLAKMNGKKTREEGVDLSFSKNKKVIKPKLVTVNCNLKWEELEDSKICEYQGFFYED